MKYIIETDRPFDGVVVNTSSDGIHADYTKLTIEEYILTRKERNLKVVSRDEMFDLFVDYCERLQEPFDEITEEKYYDMLHILPPVRFTTLMNGVKYFFISEAYFGDIHSLYFCWEGRFFTGMRNIKESDKSICAMINKFINELQ